MKKLIKSFLFTLLCICLLIPFTGCTEKKYGGIVTGSEVWEEHPDITFYYLNDKTEYEKYYFPALMIFKDDFETYNCKTFEELLRNENFLKNKDQVHLDGFIRHSFTPSRYGKISFRPMEVHSYWIFYDCYEQDEVDNVAPEEWDDYVETFFNNLDYSTYIGWIKF